MKKKKISNSKLFLGYKITTVGFNYRLSDLNCALANSQLKRIELLINKRSKIAKKYLKSFSGFEEFIELPKILNSDIKSAWHLFILNIRFDKLKINREFFFKKLYNKGITTQIHYIPIYKHPVFKDLRNNFFEGTEQYYKRCLSIPIFPDLNETKIIHIVKSIKELITKYKK